MQPPKSFFVLIPSQYPQLCNLHMLFCNSQLPFLCPHWVTIIKNSFAIIGIQIVVSFKLVSCIRPVKEIQEDYAIAIELCGNFGKDQPHLVAGIVMFIPGGTQYISWSALIHQYREIVKIALSEKDANEMDLVITNRRIFIWTLRTTFGFCTEDDGIPTQNEFAFEI